LPFESLIQFLPRFRHQPDPLQDFLARELQWALRFFIGFVLSHFGDVFPIWCRRSFSPLNAVSCISADSVMVMASTSAAEPRASADLLLNASLKYRSGCSGGMRPYIKSAPIHRSNFRSWAGMYPSASSRSRYRFARRPTSAP